MTKVEGKKATYTLKNFSREQKHSYSPPSYTILDIHVARHGDTWDSIAKRHNIPATDLIRYVIPEGVTPDGKVNAKVVNQWLFDRGGHRSPDGVNVMFPRYEIIPIPQPFAIPRRKEGASRLIVPGEEVTCWDGITYADRKPVFVEPPKFVGSVEDQNGQLFEYGVFPGHLSTRIVVLDSAGREVKVLRPSGPMTASMAARDYYDGVVASSFGTQVSAKPNNTVKQAFGHFWAGVPKFIWIAGQLLQNPTATNLDKGYENYLILESEFQRAGETTDNAVAGVRG